MENAFQWGWCNLQNKNGTRAKGDWAKGEGPYGDRGSEINELICLAEEKNTHFLVQTCVDRRAGTGNTTVARKTKRELIKGAHHVKLLDAIRRPIEVTWQLRFSQMIVHPPIGKHKKY